MLDIISQVISYNHFIFLENIVKVICNNWKWNDLIIISDVMQLPVFLIFPLKKNLFFINLKSVFY